MQLTDGRSIGQQVKSGLRLAACIVVALVLVFLLLRCTALVFDKSYGASRALRVLGVCGLVVISVVMFITTQHWAKWLFGALGYAVVRMALKLPLMHVWPYVRLLLVLIVGSLLCVRFALKDIHNAIERAALVAFVLGLSVSIVLQSVLPFSVGALILTAVQLPSILLNGKHPDASSTP